MMPSCPACGRQIRKGDLHYGSLACPWCKEKLRWPRASRLELSILGVVAIFVPFLVADWLGPRDYAPLLGGVLVLLLAAPIGAAWGLLRALLFPRKLQRDAGWFDEGTILHITSPPEPPKEQEAQSG